MPKKTTRESEKEVLLTIVEIVQIGVLASNNLNVFYPRVARLMKLRHGAPMGYYSSLLIREELHTENWKTALNNSLYSILFLNVFLSVRRRFFSFSCSVNGILCYVQSHIISCHHVVQLLNFKLTCHLWLFNRFLLFSTVAKLFIDPWL